MNLSNDIDKKETHIEKKTDSSLVLTTLIKYAAYLIIFFGVMYFLIKYILPKF
jgi:type II secretory pathway component PulF